MTRSLTILSSPLGGRVPTADPGVRLNWGYWPFMAELKNAVGGVGAVAVVVLVAVMILAALTWAAGRLAGAGKVQSISGIACLVALVAAVVVGSASGMIGWFTDLNTGF